jgi:glutamate-ammonia-ligase adenylyltransferase
MSGLPAAWQARLSAAWQPDSAAHSLERWLALREQEGWGDLPADMDALIAVFGASWTLTRFVFFRGAAAARLIDERGIADLSAAALARYIDEAAPSCASGDLQALCRARNDVLLRITLCWLRGSLDQQGAERALSDLAVIALRRLMEQNGVPSRQFNVPVAVLGMGRLAGGEMNFGSDLDLIFVHAARDQDQAAEVTRRVRAVLRSIATATAAGVLYDVDMRLRPHGTAGALVTSVGAFREYHRAPREIWERQLMTRCRAVIDPDGIGAAALDDIGSALYAAQDRTLLTSGIRSMRERVERELGRPRGRFEIKRGRGGLMDLDFLCHWLQLQHGRQHPRLRDCSTRAVLRQAAHLGLLAAGEADQALLDYEFLKRTEAVLRLWDMKNVSVFSSVPGANPALARAMAGRWSGAGSFEEAYQCVTERVRALFDARFGAPAGAGS